MSQESIALRRAAAEDRAAMSRFRELARGTRIPEHREFYLRRARRAHESYARRLVEARAAEVRP